MAFAQRLALEAGERLTVVNVDTGFTWLVTPTQTQAVGPMLAGDDPFPGLAQDSPH